MSGTLRRLSRLSSGALALAVVLAAAPGGQAAKSMTTGHFSAAANPNANADANPNPSANANTNANADANGNPNPNASADADANADANGNPNPNADKAKPDKNPTTTTTTTTTTAKPGNGNGIGTDKDKPPPGRSGELTDQGVVQSVSANAIVLKELDGSTVTVSVDKHTRVLVDGTKALLKNVKPGFVAIAEWNEGEAAQELRAFDLAHDTIVKSVQAHSVVVTKPGGTTKTIRVSAATRVYVDGMRKELQDVKPGFILVPSTVVTTVGKPVAELRVLNPS